MAINFPTPTSVGEVYTDASGNTFVCTVLGPPAQWVGSGSSTSLDNTYLRKDASNDPVTGQLEITPATDTTGLVVTQPSGNTAAAMRITNEGSGDSFVVEDSANPDSSPFVIDSSGRLLVGTSTSTGADATVQMRNDSNGDALAIQRSFNGAAAARMYVEKSRGTVGSPAVVQSGDVIFEQRFNGYDGSSYIESSRIFAAVDGTPGANTMPGRLIFSTTSTTPGASPTERMRITSGGTIFVHKTSSGSNIDGLELVKLSGGTQIQNTSSNNGTRGIVQNMRYGAGTQYAMGILYAGTEVGTISCTSTATAYNTSSDYRLKENVTPVTDGITRLQQLKPSRFNFIADPTKTVDGFLAHEVQDIVPEAITGDKDAVDDEGNPEYQGIDQSKLVPLLTAALQEAIGEIESLKARVAALESA